MLFYGKYENGRRYICAYDEEKHGTPRVVTAQRQRQRVILERKV